MLLMQETYNWINFSIVIPDTAIKIFVENFFEFKSLNRLPLPVDSNIVCEEMEPADKLRLALSSGVTEHIREAATLLKDKKNFWPFWLLLT